MWLTFCSLFSSFNHAILFQVFGWISQIQKPIQSFQGFIWIEPRLQTILKKASKKYYMNTLCFRIKLTWVVYKIKPLPYWIKHECIGILLNTIVFKSTHVLIMASNILTIQKKIETLLQNYTLWAFTFVIKHCNFS